MKSFYASHSQHKPATGLIPFYCDGCSDAREVLMASLASVDTGKADPTGEDAEVFWGCNRAELGVAVLCCTDARGLLLFVSWKRRVLETGFKATSGTLRMAASKASDEGGIAAMHERLRYYARLLISHTRVLDCMRSIGINFSEAESPVLLCVCLRGNRSQSRQARCSPHPCPPGCPPSDPFSGSSAACFSCAIRMPWTQR